MVSSELKGLTHPSLTHVEQFPPGHYATLRVDFASAAATAQLVRPLIAAKLAVHNEEPTGLDHSLLNYKLYWSAHQVVNIAHAPTLQLSFREQFEHWSRRLHDTLVAAIVKRIEMCDVPFGVLLSGGLDSSIVASVAARYIAQTGNSGLLRTFSVGMVGIILFFLWKNENIKFFF